MRQPLKNAFLQNDALGNGKRWTGLGGLKVEYQETKEVWIGHRSGGKAGSGSKIDPFNGATRALFDDKLLVLSANTNVILMLKDDEFETHGALHYVMKRGWRVVGAGMHSTQIKQISLPTDNLNFGVLYGDADDVEVHDLTIDCNFPALSAALGAHENANIYGLSARSGLFQNVRVINAGGDQETFVIGMSAFGPVGADDAEREESAPKLCRIKGCRVELPDPNGDALTGITINTGYFESATIPMEDEKPYGRRAEITDCFVDGGAYGTEADHKIAIALQIGGFHSGLISGCYVRNAQNGFFQDTCPTRNLDIINNTFDGVSGGVTFNGGGPNRTRGGTIGWNNIVSFNGGIGLNSANHMIVEGNKLWPVEGATLSPLFALIFQNKNLGPGSDTTNNLYRNNRIHPDFTLAEVLTADGATGSPMLWNNRYFDGSSIAKIPDNYFPYNGAYAERISARADASTLESEQTVADTINVAVDVSQPENSLIDLDTNNIVAPADGTMQVSAHLGFSTVTSAGYVDLILYLNEQSYALTRKKNPLTGETYAVSLTVDVEAGDTIAFHVANATGSSLTIDQDYLFTYLMALFVPTALTP